MEQEKVLGIQKKKNGENRQEGDECLRIAYMAGVCPRERRKRKTPVGIAMSRRSALRVPRRQAHLPTEVKRAPTYIGIAPQ